MEERRGTGLLLFVLLLVQLILLSAQAPDREHRGSALEAAVLHATAPVLRSVQGIERLASAAALAAADRRQLQTENRALLEELEHLRRERVERRNAEIELRLLLDALGAAPPSGHGVRLADVVRADYQSPQRSLVIQTLSGEQPAVDSPVTSHRGLVGRVVLAAGRYARVQLITDRSSSVGAMIERTRRQGIVRGDESGVLALDYVPLEADVQAGDVLLTAGIDGIYPRGLPIGTVTEVEPGDELFHRVRVAPAVDFGKLEKVYLLDPLDIPQQLVEGGSGAGPR